MAHEIKADSNTYVGYNFLTSEYYVKNLETKTATKTAHEAKLVLDITAPRNVISEEAIKALSRDYEPITSINYTLEDTGRYIKTIYFNDYKSFAIQYDEPSLYIRGSNEMWDMSSSLGVDSISTFFWQYYVYHLGLDMPQELITTIISYYKEIQKPYVYNIIEPRTEKDISEGKQLVYTNQFMINNADNSSRGEYTGTKNPDNEYSLNTYNITKAGFDTAAETYAVGSVEKNQFRINMTKLLDEGTFKVGQQIELFDTEAINGIYTITKVENDVFDEENPDSALTHLIVAEPFEKDFVPLHNQNILKRVPRSLSVQSITITGDEHAINLNETPNENEFNTNDKIEIYGTGVVDGFYTIASKSGTKIVVKEKFAQAYTPTYNLYIVRESEKEVIENSVTCLEEPSCKIGDLLQITTSNSFLENYKVLSVDGNKIYVNKAINPVLESRDGAKVWCNAYKVNHCGYAEYTEICESRQIKTINGAVVQIYGMFDATNYATNMKVYIDNKEYTISSVVYPSYNNTNVYTEGSITLTSNPPAYTYNVNKEPLYLEVRKIYKVPENSFTLNAPLPLSEGDTFEVFNNTSINGTYTVDTVENTDSIYKVYVVKDKNDEPVPELTFGNNDKNSGIIQTHSYSDKILLNLNYSRLPDRVPVGEFMLDNDEQFTEYLELYCVVTPKNQNYSDFNQPVTMKHYLGEGLLHKGEPTYMNCIGLYSEHYKDV